MSDYDNTIRQGRACVRLIEAADVLIADSPGEIDTTVLRQARELCVAQLRALVRTLPSHVSAQILAASEKIDGPTGEIGQN